LDATTIGSLLVGVGAVVGGLVAYLGKRSENALTGYSSLTDNLQEERDRLDRKVAELTTTISTMAASAAQESSLRAADQAEIARLRALVISLGGQP
jgi:hypothetical protein